MHVLAGHALVRAAQVLPNMWPYRLFAILGVSTVLTFALLPAEQALAQVEEEIIGPEPTKRAKKQTPRPRPTDRDSRDRADEEDFANEDQDEEFAEDDDQDNGDEPEDEIEERLDEEEDDRDSDRVRRKGPFVGPGGFPAVVTQRPLHIPQGLTQGTLTLGVPKGPNATGERATGNFVGAMVRADRGLNPKLQVGARLFIALVTPNSAQVKPEILGGLAAEALYAVTERISASAEVGYARPGLLAATEFAIPLYGGDLQPGAGLGALYKHMLADGKVAVVTHPKVVAQSKSQPVAGEQVSYEGTLTSIHVPITAYYQYDPQTAAILKTGVFSGSGASFSAQDGGTVPLVLGGQHTLEDGDIDLGAIIGFASLIGSEAGVYPSRSDSFYLGLFATWRRK
jgi:hypothetical protein